MPIWAKLGLIMIPPVLATLVIGTNGLLDNLDTVSNADTTRVLSQLVKESGTLVDGLQNERSSAVMLLAADTEQEQAPLKTAFADANKAVDDAGRPYTVQRSALQGVDTGMSDLLQRIDSGISGLTTVRSQVNERKITISDLGNRYQVLITQLLEIRERAAQIAGSTDLGDGLRAAAAVATYKEFLSEERIVVHHAFDQGAMTPYLRKNFIATLTGQDQALRGFEAVAPGADVDLYTGTVTGPALRKASNFQGIVEALPENSRITAFSASDWDLAMKDHAGLVRRVEQALDQKVETTAGQLRDEVTQRILVQTGLVLGMLVIAVLSAWLVARSMARSLRELRHGALSIAQYGLPQAVARLRDPQMAANMSPVQMANQIAEPLPVRSKDEFGQVTEAFNAVHLEAVRTAAEQAQLRSSVATMFVNLARRSQILVDRLIGHLDRLERGEEDPDRLAELFQLDHLATRMRRNDENLLVLAGADSTRVQREPAALLDVLRAAQSEVEHYTRIEFGIVDRDIEVAAHAVNDLVHLIAELFDNATAFSPPDSSVMVEARRVGDRAVLYVEDRGIGMSPDMLADVNERLATPPMVDVAVSRMMGLVVVARLAARHGVKVELRSSAERGIIADVTLPTAVLVPRALAGRAGAPSREPSVAPAIESRQQPPARPTFGQPLALESGSGLGRAFEGSGAGRAFSGSGADRGFGGSGADRGFDNGRAFDNGSGSGRMFEAPPVPPIPVPPVTPPPATPSSAPASRPGSIPAWSDLTGAVNGGGYPHDNGLNGDPLPRRSVQPSGGDPHYGSQIPRQPTGSQQDRSPYDRLETPPPASQMPVSAVPVSAVPVSSPPSVPPAAAPPVWPPVSEDRQSPAHSPTGEFSAVRPGSSSVVPQHIPYADETMELPIFRELESAWFSTRRSSTDDAGPTPSTYAEPDLTITAQFATVDTNGNGGGQRGTGSYGEGAGSRDEMVTAQAGWGSAARPAQASEAVPAAYRPTWQTAADEGWAAATAAASHVESAEVTQSGLPKRTPMAQLVPGGVEKATTNTQKRSPEGVRGLLSAYHRGVQRGRTQHREDDFSTDSTETGGRSGKEHDA